MNTLLGLKDLTDDFVKSKWANSVDGSKFILVDGVNIHYRDQGDHSKPTILAIHGIADSLYTWDMVSQKMIEDYRFVRFDIPGFGLSDHLSTNDYSLDRWINLISKMLTSLGIYTIHLLGNSLGGYIAWNFALKYPNEVKSLMLLDPAAFPLSKAPWIVEISKNSLFRSVYSKCSPRLMTYLTLRKVIANKKNITDKLINQLHEIALRSGNRKSYMDIFTILLSMKDIYPDNIKNLTQSTVVAFGAKDCWIPTSQLEQWKSVLPSVQTKVYLGAGHCPQLECPENVVEDLVGLITQSS